MFVPSLDSISPELVDSATSYAIRQSQAVPRSNREPSRAVARASTLNNIRLERTDNLEVLLFLLGRNLELVQGIDEMVHDDIEIAFSNPEAGVKCLRISTDDLARPARYVADEVNVFLDERLTGIRSHPLEERSDLWVFEEFRGKVVHHR